MPGYIEEPGGVNDRVARTEAQGLNNVTLCFFGATDKKLTEPDGGIGVSKISILTQSMFTFGDPLGGAPHQNIDNAQRHMAPCMVRDRRQGSRQFRFCRSESRPGVSHE